MADIVLKDRNGNSIEYPGVNHIKVKTTDGETRDFVDSETVPEVVENLPIALDFSGGDQEIVAPDGMVVKSAVIQQPATLIPENIAEGVDIAGIVGSLAAGGGNAKIASGYASPGVAYDWEITHNLGVVPDFVCVVSINSSYSSFTSGAITSAVGTSANIAVTSLGYITVNKYATAKRASAYAYITASTGVIHDANETTVKIGNSSHQLYSNCLYQWFAIGGLT